MQKFEGLLSGPSRPFLCCNKLGPDNNPHLAQIMTLQNGLFFLFLLLKMCWNTYFIVFFQHQPKFGQKRGKQKTITFHILQNTSYKKNVLLQLPFWPKIGVFFSTCVFLKPKTLMLNKKHNWIPRKAKIRKRDLKKKTRHESKKTHTGLMKKTLQLNLLMFLVFKKQNQRR